MSSVGSFFSYVNDARSHESKIPRKVTFLPKSWNKVVTPVNINKYNFKDLSKYLKKKLKNNDTTLTPVQNFTQTWINHDNCGTDW